MQNLNCPHCDVEIDEHEASGCLNAWVAEAVMGGVETMNFQEKAKCYWKFETSEGKGMLVDSKVFRGTALWSPSTRIKDAWEVLMKLYEQDWTFSITFRSVMLCHESWIADSVAQSRPVIEEKGDIELAVCRAAIKATNES